MNFSDLIASLAQKANKNLQNSNDSISNMADLERQKLKEQNTPEFQGPPIPDNLPQEEDYYNKVTNATIGSLGPTNSLLSKEQIAKNAMNSAFDNNLPMATRAATQNNASRAVDFAQRAKDQLKFTKLRGLLGR